MTDLTFRSGRFLWVATLVALGCGSKAATTYPDAQVIDANIPDTTTGGDGPDASKPQPVSGAGNQLLYAGAAHLLTGGPPCTSEAGATSDRWCAFTTTPTIGFPQLFVVNVSKAAAGVGITCGSASGDPNCLRLTRGFFEEANQPAAHAAIFQGDTLVYFDVTGTPYGWRPGMANGRALADSRNSLNVRNCFPASKGSAVICLRDLSGTDVIMTDLLVGRVDSPNDPPLSRVETVLSIISADSPPRFQIGFPTPAGDTFAWSSRPTATEPETLNVQKVDDPSTRRQVASDVFQWSASPDGSRWYWLSKYGTVTGDLTSAPFAGGAATTLIPGVHDYLIAPSGTLAALTGTMELKGIVDPVGAPTTVASVDTGARGLLGIGDQGQVAYLKTFDPIFPISDIYVKRVDGTGRACTLTSQIDGLDYNVQFLPQSTGVLWARVVSLDGPVGTLPPIDVALTNLTDCSKTIVASKVSDGAWDLTTGNHVTFIDQSDGQDGTLRFRGIVGGNALSPDAPTVIGTRVDRFISVLPNPTAVLYTVNAASSADGLYIHAIAGGTVSQPDAATTPQPDAALADAGTGGDGAADLATNPTDSATDIAAATDGATTASDAGTAPDGFASDGGVDPDAAN